MGSYSELLASRGAFSEFLETHLVEEAAAASDEETAEETEKILCDLEKCRPGARSEPLAKTPSDCELDTFMFQGRLSPRLPSFSGDRWYLCTVLSDSLFTTTSTIEAMRGRSGTEVSIAQNGVRLDEFSARLSPNYTREVPNCSVVSEQVPFPGSGWSRSCRTRSRTPGQMASSDRPPGARPPLPVDRTPPNPPPPDDARPKPVSRSSDRYGRGRTERPQVGGESPSRSFLVLET